MKVSSSLHGDCLQTCLNSVEKEKEWYRNKGSLVKTPTGVCVLTHLSVKL